MNGGTVLVNGPTNGGNGSLDYDGEFVITNGLLAAAGSVGMAQTPSSSSNIPCISMSFSSVKQSGTIFHIKSEDGDIVTFAPAKNYQNVIICSPDISAGGTYSVYSGGSVNVNAVDGLYLEGTYSGGTQVVSFTVSGIITNVNESGLTSGGGGMGGGMLGGGRRER